MVDVQKVRTENPAPPIKMTPVKKLNQNDPVPVGQNPVGEKPVGEKPYAESKAHYVDMEILELQKQLLITEDPKKIAEIKQQIAALKEKKNEQNNTASLSVDKKGNINLKLKQEVAAGYLSKLFDMRPGALKENPALNLSPPMGKDISGITVKDYDSALIKKGEEIKLDPSEINHQGFVRELWNRFTQ